MDQATLETIALELLSLVIKYVGGSRASDLLMQAAREAANQEEDTKFGPPGVDREAPTGR